MAGRLDNKIHQISSDFLKRIRRDQLEALEKTAFDLIEKIEVPVDTHNLWDSIGCGIYFYGSLMKTVFPPMVAIEPRDNLWGYKEIQDAIIDDPPSVVLNVKGWALYYVAAMPYAEAVDEREDADVLLEEQVELLYLRYLRL